MGRGIAVITEEQFDEYRKSVEQRLDNIESELEMYRSVLPQWISRAEAMEFLSCGSSKLADLVRRKRITISTGSGHPKYYIPSLRNYMLSQSTDLKDINNNLKKIFQKRLE